MARKKKKPRRVPERGRDLVAEALVVGALALLTLVLVALVTYSPEPAGPSGQRAFVGVVGHGLAHALWHTFGVVSFALVGFGLFTAVVRLVTHRVSTPILRVVGAVLLTLGLCGLVHQSLRPRGVILGGEHPIDVTPGGALGEGVFDLMVVPFGAFGSFLFAVVLTCTGFALATDWLLYEMLYDGIRKVLSFGSHARKFWPQPAIAAVGAMGSKARDMLRRDPDAAAAQQVRDMTKAASVAQSAATAVAPPPEDAVKSTSLHDPVVVVAPDLLPGGAASGAAGGPSASMQFDSHAAPTPSAPIEQEPVLEVKLAPAPDPQPAKVAKPRRKGKYELPGLDLLDRPRPRDLRSLERAIQANADILQRTLQEFRIDGRVVAFQQGPVVTMLEVALSPGTKVTKIHSLADDLAMALKVQSVRIVAPIPGKSTVGVEIPNPVREDVRLISLLESEAFRSGEQALPLLLGMRGDGSAMVDDLAGMPHLLLAGATGSGKSVCVNTVLCSMLMTRSPDDVRLILIDPKQVELAFFANVPHLLSPVVTDMKRASSVLEWAVQNMEERYDLLRRFEVRSIASYNQLGEQAIKARIEELGLSDEIIPVRLPYIVIIVDELADLLLSAGRDVEKLIQRLAQKSRAVGIHIILATQRPSTDVITGLIKANMPTRIAFQVASKVDSRVILDQNGAEKLLGMGDMLYLPPRSSSILRAQGTFVSDKEVKRIVKFLKERYSQEFDDELTTLGTTDLLDEADKDVLYDEAVQVVLGERRGSASLLQRALAIGYTRASRLLDLMRKEGVVGAYKGSKASDVLMTLEQYQQRVAEAQAAKKKGGG